MTTSQESMLSDAIINAFPPRAITREMIDEPSARWETYEHVELLRVQLAGRSWNELDDAFLELHRDALIMIGDSSFSALLPAFLMYLVNKPAYNEVPFAVAGQLLRRASAVDQGIFDRRMQHMTAEQLAIVKRVVAYLSTKEPMEDVMAASLASYWSDV